MSVIIGNFRLSCKLASRGWMYLEMHAGEAGLDTALRGNLASEFLPHGPGFEPRN